MGVVGVVVGMKVVGVVVEVKIGVVVDVDRKSVV